MNTIMLAKGIRLIGKLKNGFLLNLCFHPVVSIVAFYVDMMQRRRRPITSLLLPSRVNDSRLRDELCEENDKEMKIKERGPTVDNKIASDIIVQKWKLYNFMRKKTFLFFLFSQFEYSSSSLYRSSPFLLRAIFPIMIRSLFFVL